MRKKVKSNEKSLHRAVCDYIRLQYPGVLFNSDMAGAMKLTIGQAVAMKSLRSNRGFPDITIYEPKGKWHGLLLELKADGLRLKNGGLPMTDHIREQASVIRELTMRNYLARFAVGFDEAKSIIDWYMSGNF